MPIMFFECDFNDHESKSLIRCIGNKMYGTENQEPSYEGDEYTSTIAKPLTICYFELL